MKLFIRDKLFYKEVLLICIPIVFQQVINMGVNLTDTIMLGYFGETQLSACSLANQFYFIFNVFCLGVGGGAAVMTAQFWGQKDHQNIKKVLTIALRICTVVALLFTVISAVFPHVIMQIFTPDELVIAKGVEYFRFMAYVFLFHGIAFVAVIVLRTVGVVYLSLIASVCSFGINILFNYMFIFGKLGAPKMEIGGAAVGTLLARICEFLIVMIYLLFVDKRIAYRLRDFFMKCTDIIRPFLKFALPVIISDLVYALGNNALAMIMGRMGKEMVTANAITSITVQLCTIFLMGLSSSGSILIGNTVGRKEFLRAQEEGRTIIGLSVLTGIVGGIGIYLLCPVVVGFYQITPQTQAMTYQLMYSYGVIIVFQAVALVITNGVLRGGGDTTFLMAADVLFLWIASIPLGYLAGIKWGCSPFVVNLCLRIDLVIKSVWCLFRFHSRKWIRFIEK